MICAGKKRDAASTDADLDGYGPACDLWSCGVILFMLLGGYPPFWHESKPQLLEAVERGEFEFADPVWQEVSWQAKDLVSKLLVVDPDKRLTPAQARLVSAVEQIRLGNGMDASCSAGSQAGGVGFRLGRQSQSPLLLRKRAEEVLVVWALLQVLEHPWLASGGAQERPIEERPLLQRTERRNIHRGVRKQEGESSCIHAGLLTVSLCRCLVQGSDSGREAGARFQQEMPSSALKGGLPLLLSFLSDFNLERTAYLLLLLLLCVVLLFIAFG